MKKLLVMVVVIMMFTSSLVVNAASDQRSTQGNKVNMQLQNQIKQEGNFDSFLETLEQKQDERIEKSTSKWSEMQVKRDLNSVKFLELVATYAPNMYDNYELAINAHNSIQEELFSERNEIYLAFATETNVLILTLKAEVDAKVKTGEITIKEGRVILKEFLTERKESFKALLETYQIAIATEKSAQEVRSQEVKAIRLTLKEAIKSEDSETIATSMESLYTYMLDHIEFDQFKLTTLQEIF